MYDEIWNLSYNIGQMDNLIQLYAIMVYNNRAYENHSHHLELKYVSSS